MLDEHKMISMSLFKFYSLCAITVAALVSLFVVINRQSAQSVDQSALAGIISEGNFGLVPLIGEDGKITVYSPNGNKVTACGKIVGSRIEGKCKASGKITNFGSFTYTIQVASPPCTVGYDSDGNVYEVHATKDDQHPKRWKAGQIDCHEAPKESHSWP